MAAAHIDEDFQAERWGADAEAMARGPLARVRGGGARVVAVGRALTRGLREPSLKPPSTQNSQENMVFAVINTWQKWCC